MVRYWKIGTSAHKMIEVFAKVSEECFLGMPFHIVKGINNKYQLIDQKEKPIYEFNSFSTASQYLKTWEALGFINKEGENLYIIGTNFKNIEDLYELSEIYICKSSGTEYIDSYRKTLIINILVESKILNSIDLSKKNISKKRGVFTIDDVIASISKYERKLSNKGEFIIKIKEIYDKQF